MANTSLPAWKLAYQSAVLETDPDTLRERIEVTEIAIFDRLNDLKFNAEHHAERLAIRDAITVLRSLQKERLGYPEFPGE